VSVLKPSPAARAWDNEIYLSLLSGGVIQTPNHLWSTDIAYVPMQADFLYL
jgi:hypothetical protein